MKIILIARRILAWHLFSRRAELVGAWDIIKWWEMRRFAFNAIVGVAGLFTCIAGLGELLLMDKLRIPVELPDPPVFVLLIILAYGFMANVCFTGGWAAEIIAGQVWGEKAGSFGEIAFFFGLAFSVLLTLIPAVLVGVLMALVILRI